MIAKGRELAFGQQAGGIVQCAYTTPDIEQGMRDFTERLAIAPWFVMGPFVPPEGMYRGQPTSMRLTLAIGFAGHMMIELIQQHDDLPSVYQETIRVRGHGFHHWAIASLDFDADVARYQAQGYEVAFSDRSPRGVRIVYMDTGRDLPGMLEIIELTEAIEARYAEMYEASRTFDGKDPIRRG
ncbi:MAG TPA: VOC family protein [Stellaceae bacterium]|nr:VOC family protein [Stellaceae bacterium]